MTGTADLAAPDAMVRLRAALEAVAVPSDVAPMTAYMKDRFPFLGVKTPALRAAAKPWLDRAKSAEGDRLIEFADRCWAEPEREFQSVAATALRRGVGNLEPRHLDDLARLITTKAWWDTVDSLAVHSVGPLVDRHRELASVMDDWIDHDDIWLARTAILHQLMYKERTDSDRLFDYADRRAGDTEFFIRKALGWALRQYARTDPEAVEVYVDANRDRLSGLTVREALKHIDRQTGD